jgi:hypothetical protein
MRSSRGPAVLRLWCAGGHAVGSLIDIATGDALASFVPPGAAPQRWPPTHRITGKRATWMEFSCQPCGTDFGDSVEHVFAALRFLRSHAHRTTGDFLLAPLPAAPPRPLLTLASAGRPAR